MGGYMGLLMSLLVSGTVLASEPDLRAMAAEIAIEHGLDPLLFIAIIEQESAFKISAYNSKTRDYGLGQINEYNVRALGLDRKRLLTDARYNLEVSASILSYFQRRFGHEHLWYTRYNCGAFKGAPMNRSACRKYASLINKKLNMRMVAQERF
jgi:soluble lytic murein transglycosylase-like protein